MKSVEQNKRGMEHRSINDILADKLYWTFQPEKIGDIVRKGSSELAFPMTSDENKTFTYSFGPSTSKKIIKLQQSFAERKDNSIFILAKEVLSLQSVILESRSDKFNAFGSDDTYYDLAQALKPRTRGKNYKSFADVRSRLNNVINGRIEFNDGKNEWIFKDSDLQQFSISLTSEGIKKISILDVLLGNHYLSRNSAIFIDEPESALHPQFVSNFVEMIFELSKCGIQFFIASHSYFVIKKLYLLAHQHNESVPVISFLNSGIEQHNLRDEMQDNPIIQESINLYHQELAL